MVSAQACRAWGCGFESRLPRHFKTENSCLTRQAAVFLYGIKCYLYQSGLAIDLSGS